MTIKWLTNITWLNKPLNAITTIIIFGVSAFSFYFFCWGFEALNKFFWNRDESRIKRTKIKEINYKKPKKTDKLLEHPFDSENWRQYLGS